MTAGNPILLMTSKACFSEKAMPFAGCRRFKSSDIFLNFSTTNPIQATLIEKLLFFTDNRNQPRKISIDKGAGYYTDEAQISVAKYNPFEPISLVKKETGIVAASPTPTSTVFTLDVANPKITVGMSVVSASKSGVEKIKGNEPKTAILNQDSEVSKNACCKFNFLS